MSNKSDAVKHWRKNTKSRMVEAMGGKCVCCGYKKCNQALDLHHINPEEKEFGFGKIMSHPTKWIKIVEELKKCVLVCCRCHKEIHSGARKLPESYNTYNEEIITVKKEPEQTFCPVCGNEKKNYNITCSRTCASKRTHKIDWDSVDLEKLLKEFSFVKIGDILGVSDVAVRKKAKKLFLL